MQNANLVSPRFWSAAIALAIALTGCGSEKRADAASDVKALSYRFTVDVGGHTANLQIAVLPAEQEHGLMQRNDLGRDDGMIFVFARPEKQSFWMRNTPEALDVAYLTPDGVIAEIYPMYPYDERPVNSLGDQMKYALEMPQGWFSANGVRPGASVDLKAVAAAVKERGFEPEKLGLR